MTALSIFNPVPTFDKPGVMLTEAFELFDKGYAVAAAMTARVSLESYVRMLCHTHDLRLAKNTKGSRVKKQVLMLVEAEIFSPEESELAGKIIDIGNQAAHGYRVDAEDFECALLDLCGIVKGGAL